MTGLVTVTMRLTAVAHPWFADAVDLFDDYRQHYGANPAPDAVAAWLRDQVVAERQRIYLAGDTSRAYGMCSVVIAPAALTLRTAWLIRDLFVAPAVRRQGVARILLGQVTDEARTAGAHRLSLQTDAANERAISLYAQYGFGALSDVALMDRIL
jgi:GNAT superfamily N-acetyltransferase